MSNEQLLNIGCGGTSHPKWVNVDINVHPYLLERGSVVEFPATRGIAPAPASNAEKL